MIWILAPPVNDVLTKNSSAYPILNLTEQVFGIATVAMLILLKSGKDGDGRKRCLGFAILFLAGYYLAWIFYYRGVVSPWLLIIGIAAMPPLYFFFSGLWMRNDLVLIPCAVFGITHLAITCSSYWKP